MDGRITCPSSLLPSTTRRSCKNWTIRGGARRRAGSDQIGGRFACSLSRSATHTCSRAAKAGSPPTGDVVRGRAHPTRPLAEGEDGSETEHIFTFLRFLRTAATSGNLRWSHERLTRLWRALKAISLNYFGNKVDQVLRIPSLSVVGNTENRNRASNQPPCHRDPPSMRFLSPPLELAACVPRRVRARPRSLPGMDEWISDEINSGSD